MALEGEQEFLSGLREVEFQYIQLRILKGMTRINACKMLKIHPRTPYRWHRYQEIKDYIRAREANRLTLAMDRIDDLLPEAVLALGAALKEKAHRVAAANSILDRGGVPKKSSVDMTSGGAPLPAPSITEVVVKLPDELSDGSFDESLDDQ